MLQTTYLHSGWEFAEKNWPGGRVGAIASGWLPAAVPGHVHLDLVENGVIADPFLRMSELGCQWVDEKDWVYRTRFEWWAKDGLPRRVLRFEGLDTICEIFLNDDRIATHDNMFVPLEVDVTKLLKAGDNDLRIEFQSAVRVGKERRQAYFAQEGLAEDTRCFDERAFVRKAQYMFGWDWSPRLVSCGIWRPISLIEFTARITGIQIQQTHLESGGVEILCDVEHDGEADGWMVHGFTPDGESIDEFQMAGPGQPIVISDPVLWDPRNPRLYHLAFTLASANSVPEVMFLEGDEEPIVVHEIAYREVGLVQTRLLQEPDAFGESFEFEVNGKPLWIRGANWIPDHSFPSVVDKTRYRDRLEKAKDMGFNMLRVWGGGLYETDEFYELCDELGLLVWQDFAFACSYYPDDAEWQETIRVEAETNVKRLRSHPALALWCGNNENLEMFANLWGGAHRHPKRYYGEKHYDRVLPAVVKEWDPEICYIATSPIGEDPQNDGKASKQIGPNSGGFGDQHCWDVWHGRGDWKYYADSTGRFSSEYGFASSCNSALWSSCLDAEDWLPHSPAVQWHDKTGKGHETFHNLVKLHYPDSVSLDDWVYYSQLNQRDALRFGVEHYRRSEFCKGSLIWQLNDCWPVQSWAILDGAGDYKALAYDLRRLYADRLLSIVREEDRVVLWAVNDGEDTWVSSVFLSAGHLRTGELLEIWEADFELAPGARQPVLEASIHGMSVPDVLMTAGDIFGEIHTWQLISEPKSARFAPSDTLVVSTWAEDLLTIKTEVPLVDLMLTENGSTAKFRTNFVTIAEPGVFTVEIDKAPTTIEARSLAGVHRVKLTRSPL
ncbi:MAG: glycoside hydrolase family 2 TIM barrel-domain containing protein [Fimbriimonas sp.]|nr:glycoside hydrolase family 2 TIM barrel-domain containing protein [Fimbriimonas sp.]